ncbi:MAG: hypothetical protein HYV52_01225 [Parcubacteria group bacterium]|nr:hypothetical protein [Parcubacteria group bacterium]
MNPELKHYKFERQESSSAQPEQKEAMVENSIESLKQGEFSILAKAARVLENLSGQVLEKSRKAKAIAAFSLLLQASTLFAEMAWAQEDQKYAPKEVPAEPTAEFALKKQPRLEPEFDWKKIVNEINVSYETPYIPKKTFEAEEIPVAADLNQTEFYGDFSVQEKDKTSKFYVESVQNSLSSQSFFEKLKEKSGELNAEQKIYFLQRLGNDLRSTYNYEMFQDNEHVVVSDEKMFNAIKNGSPSGICGNIHTFMVKAAENLGIEAWLQSGFTSQTGHVWMGAIVEREDKKEIAFIDYGNLIPTGTLNYKEALGVIERRNKEIALFNSFVGDTKEVLFPVKSYAQEIMEKAAGFKEIGKELSKRLEAGKIEKERKLEIKLSPETKEIEFSRDHLGFYYVNYQNSGNVYNSLEDLNAARGSLRLGDKKLGAETDLTIMHFDIKDMGTKLFPRDAIAARLAANYIESKKLTKGEHGKFVLNFGATLESGIAYFLEQGMSASKISGKGEAGLGTRLIYLSPAETGKFFVEAQDAFRGTIDDFQNQDFVVQEILRKIAVGGEYKVREGTLINLETALAQLDYGRNYLIKAGLTEWPIKSEISWLKELSALETVKPSKELIEGSLGYQFALSKIKQRPIGEINIFGGVGEEKYKDAEPQKIQNIGVKLRIILW